MRIRIVGVLIGALAMFALAAPAAAQGPKVDFAAGYQYFTFLEDGAANVPTGWGASVAVGKEWVKFVADAGGHYLDHGDHFAKLHTFQGGVEVSGKGGTFVPFARVLTGLGLLSDLSNETVWVLTPEAGVKVMANKRVGVQASVGFPYLRNGDGSANGLRIFAGVVIRK